MTCLWIALHLCNKMPYFARLPTSSTICLYINACSAAETTCADSRAAPLHARSAVASVARRQRGGDLPSFIKSPGYSRVLRRRERGGARTRRSAHPRRSGGGWSRRGDLQVDEEMGGVERNRNCLTQNTASSATTMHLTQLCIQGTYIKQGFCAISMCIRCTRPRVFFLKQIHRQDYFEVFFHA